MSVVRVAVIANLIKVRVQNWFSYGSIYRQVTDVCKRSEMVVFEVHDVPACLSIAGG